MVSAITAAPQAPQTEAAPALPEHRLAAFRTAVASRLRGGATPALLVREQQALCAALADPAFENAMANAFAAEMAVQQPNPDYRIGHDAALLQVKGILHNRIHDAQQFIAKLGEADFVSAALAEAGQPEPLKKEYDLPPHKKEEIIRRLIQKADPDGAEPAVHVAASAQGQRQTHMALANIFRPKAGSLRAPLVDALARVWPEATGAQIEQLAVTWLKARHDPAHSVADGLKPECGELYLEAMRRVAPEQTIAPVTQVAVPLNTPAKLQTADIMMDTI